MIVYAEATRAGLVWLRSHQPDPAGGRGETVEIEHMGIERALVLRAQLDEAIATAKVHAAQRARESLPRLREEMRRSLEQYERTKRLIAEIEGGKAEDKAWEGAT